MSSCTLELTKTKCCCCCPCWQHHAAALHVLLLRQQRSHRSQKRFIACRLSLSPSFVQGSFLLLPRRKPLRICSREVELLDKRARKNRVEAIYRSWVWIDTLNFALLWCGSWMAIPSSLLSGWLPCIR